MFNEEQAIFDQGSLLVTHKDDILHQFTFVALETQSSFTLVQFYHAIGYEPNVSSKKDRRGTKNISFILISKPSHNFVSTSPVILFVQLLTLIKKMVWTKNPDGRNSPPFLFTLHIRVD